MKNLKYIIALILAVLLVIFAVTSRADDQKAANPSRIRSIPVLSAA